MIGPPLRRVLRVIVWIYMVAGVIAVAPIHLTDFLGGDAVENAIPSAIFALLAPVVQGAFLLVLLSIDERLERRG